MADRISTKKSVRMSCFQLVYGVDAVFLVSLAIPVLKLLQEEEAKPNDTQRRINHLIHFQWTREEVYNNTRTIQGKIKKIHDKRIKADDFQLDDVVLKWDARNEDKGKHGKFDSLWKGPYKFAVVQGTHAFLCKISLEKHFLEGMLMAGCSSTISLKDR